MNFLIENLMKKYPKNLNNFQKKPDHEKEIQQI